MGSPYPPELFRGFPNPVGLASVPRSSEERRLLCCNDAENWSRLPPNHSFSLLLMSARLMETVPGMVYEMPMLCALRSGRVREAASLLFYRLDGVSGAAPLRFCRLRGPRRVRGAALRPGGLMLSCAGARTLKRLSQVGRSHNAAAPSR